MTRRRRNKNKWLYLCAIILIAGLLAAGYVIWKDQKEDSFKSDDGKGQMEQVERPVEEEKPEEKPEEVPKKEEVVQYDGEDPNEESSLSGAITYAGVNGGKLMIRVNIDQYLEDGTCALTLKKGDVTIYNSIARIIGGATTATCEGFDIATGELQTGELKVEITLNAGGKKGVIRGKAEI